VRWFLAPVVGGGSKLPGLSAPVELRHGRIEQLDADVLVTGYVHDP
jgi:hypothetical protein